MAPPITYGGHNDGNDSKTIVSLVVAARGRVNEAIFNAGALKTWNAVEFGGLPT